MKISPKKKDQFQSFIWDFYAKNKRSSLPWRKQITPYRIWISEVMLQQTQADRVISFFNRWMEAFPTVESLAQASARDILKLWKGLGYNSRALRLKQAAQVVVSEYDGVFPKTVDQLVSLPGVGPYTAGAIVAFAYNKPVVMIETNIRRVFIYHFWDGGAAEGRPAIHDRDILTLISETLPPDHIRIWYYALMDYGSYLGKELKQSGKKFNPNTQSRHYTKQSTFKGSDRQIRGKILEILLSNHRQSIDTIIKKVSDLSHDHDRIEQVIGTLERDGFISLTKQGIIILKQ